MLLSTDEIGFSEPSLDLRIHLFNGTQPKQVHMIACGNGVYASETRRLEAAGEHDVSIDPALMQTYRSKAHAHLKGDASGFRDDEYWAQALHHGFQAPVDRDDLWGLPHKVRLESVPCAGMRLIGVGERTAACGAHPQR